MDYDTMPYIKNRVSLDKILDELATYITSDGDLTYCFYRLCLIKAHDKGHSYDTWKSLVGVLECTKLELYRREIALYETKKIIENGDVLI